RAVLALKVGDDPVAALLRDAGVSPGAVFVTEDDVVGMMAPERDGESRRQGKMCPLFIVRQNRESGFHCGLDPTNANPRGRLRELPLRRAMIRSFYSLGLRARPVTGGRSTGCGFPI